MLPHYADFQRASVYVGKTHSFFVTQYAHPKDVLYVSIFYVKNLH